MGTVRNRQTSISITKEPYETIGEHDWKKSRTVERYNHLGNFQSTNLYTDRGRGIPKHSTLSISLQSD